jgi:DNA-binding MarR family transcriptional regulator
MSIEFLHKLSTHRGPLDLTRPDEVDHVLVLRAAGLVSAFTLRSECPAREIARFLSLTPEGRGLLARATEEAAHSTATRGWSSSSSSATHPQPPPGPHP